MSTADVVSLGECKSIVTRWIALYVIGAKWTYFDSFEVEHIPTEFKMFKENKNIKINFYRIQAKDSIMCEYFSILY